MVELRLETLIFAPRERCFDLSRSVDVHLLGTQQTGEQAVGGVTTGLMKQGDLVRWRARHFGVWQHLTSRITAYDRPHLFQDTMTEGAFASMQHDHLFTARGPNETSMGDVLRFEAPLGVIGRLAELLVLERYMSRFLTSRNLVLKSVAESEQWRQFLPG